MKRTKLTTKDLILIALFAALTAVLSQIMIPLPFSPVPLNLATLSVFLAGGLLGAVKGGMSQCVYVLLGTVGVPVFGGFTSGFGILAGPTGGYIVGYILAAFVIGLLIDKLPNALPGCAISMVIGMLIYFTTGTAWFMYSMKMDFLSTLSMCVFPYLPGDFMKIALAVTLVKRLERIVRSCH